MPSVTQLHGPAGPRDEPPRDRDDIPHRLAEDTVPSRPPAHPSSKDRLRRGILFVVLIAVTAIVLTLVILTQYPIGVDR
jgi:hypothetical protein